MRILEAQYFQTGHEIREHVMAESPLESEVLRQAILSDKWNPMPEHSDLIAPKCYAYAAELCRSGGQIIFHAQFHKEIVLHYQVREQITEGFLAGFFELRIWLFEKQKGRQVGEFTLLSCLVILRHPPFQTGWYGALREFFVCPWWYYFSEKAEPHGVVFKPSVRDFDNGPLFVSSLTERHAEWDCLPPHISLVDPSSINIDQTREAT